VLIDAEHGPLTYCHHGPAARVGGHRHARGGAVPGHADWVLKQVLDAGAQTVMVPWSIRWSRPGRSRPPAASRRRGGAAGGSNTRSGGFGALAGYATTANAQICLIVQIEGIEAMENIEAIAAVDGVDALFIGPADLGCDMGHTDDLGADALWQAVEEAVARIAATGKAAGVFTGPDRTAR
jgi:4-hydroxy-2-oxoheptanedioate aldolase